MIIPIESQVNLQIYIKVTKHLLLIYTSVLSKVVYSMNNHLKNIANVKNGGSLLIQCVIHHEVNYNQL